jgi:hypothetical protein
VFVANFRDSSRVNHLPSTEVYRFGLRTYWGLEGHPETDSSRGMVSRVYSGTRSLHMHAESISTSAKHCDILYFCVVLCLAAVLLCLLLCCSDVASDLERPTGASISALAKFSYIILLHFTLLDLHSACTGQLTFFCATAPCRRLSSCVPYLQQQLPASSSPLHTIVTTLI